MKKRRSPGDPRTCPVCGVTGEAGDRVIFLGNGSTRCRACSRDAARARYPARRAEIAAKRRKRRELLQSSSSDGSELSEVLAKQATCLRIRNWIRYGRGDCEDAVGHPWRAVAEMLERAGLDREDLGTMWELDLSRGERLEDWIIRRL